MRGIVSKARANDRKETDKMKKKNSPRIVKKTSINSDLLSILYGGTEEYIPRTVKKTCLNSDATVVAPQREQAKKSFATTMEKKLASFGLAVLRETIEQVGAHWADQPQGVKKSENKC